MVIVFRIFGMVFWGLYLSWFCSVSRNFVGDGEGFERVWFYGGIVRGLWKVSLENEVGSRREGFFMYFVEVLWFFEYSGRFLKEFEEVSWIFKNEK